MADESRWQIGYPQLIIDSMNAVLRHLLKHNQSEIVIWKPEPSPHATKNKGNEGADDWCRFENAYIRLQEMKPEYAKISVEIIENNSELSVITKDYLIDACAEDNIAELTTTGRRMMDQPKVNRRTSAAAKKKMRSQM